MEKYLKRIGKHLLSGVVFAIFYVLLSYFMGDKIDIINIIGLAIGYVIILCLLDVIAPHLKKIIATKEQQ